VFVRSLGMRAEAADDVAQEAFVVAFEKLQTFERGTNFGAWVRTIARFFPSVSEFVSSRPTFITLQCLVGGTGAGSP